MNFALAFMVIWIYSSQLYGQTIEEQAPKATDSGAKIFMVNIGVGAIQPSGAFKRKIHAMRGQINISGFGQIKSESPLFAGVEVGYSVLQDFGTTLPFVVDGILEDWAVETKSQILYTEIGARYYLPFKIYTVDLFSEFALGSNIFFTTTTFTPPNVEAGGDTGDSDVDHSSATFRYGLGIGFNLPLYQMIYLQGRINYAAGLSTRYYAEKGSIGPIQDSTIEAFELQKSTTDILKWDIGLTFAF